MATIHDVAKMAGVSPSTVSLAFSNPGRVSDDKLERIRKAAEAVGYAADPIAQSLRSGRSRLIGLVAASIGNPFHTTMLSELESYAVANGYFVVIVDSAGFQAQERALIDALIGLRVAGVVLGPSGFDLPYAHYIRDLNIPIVSFDHKIEGMERDFVGSDNRLATAMLTEHLLQLGHRRIAFISGKETFYTAIERKRGFYETMAGAGVEIDESLVVNGRYEGDVAYAHTMRLMTRPDRPTAIIGANNDMALAALKAIQELGFHCPEQISLAMVNDVPWSSVITPKLTMVVQNPVELGQLAAQRILHRIMSREAAAEPARDFILTPRFVPGASCKPL